MVFKHRLKTGRQKLCIRICLVLFIPVVLQSSGHLLAESKPQGAFQSGVWKNLFVELLQKDKKLVDKKIEDAFQQLFYGEDSSQRIYYPVEPDMGYILDVYHNDVRSEGMSYGMIVAVQLNKKTEFDRLWKWSKNFLQHKEGVRAGYFAWHARADGMVLDSNSASDGEEWIVTALFLASARWGDGAGIFHYRKEAQNILDAMLSKEESSQQRNVVTTMFSKKEKQIVFVPSGEADDFTDPSYHTPHFYELWALAADKENQFWRDAASASREFLKKAVHPKTGLAPDYAHFDGEPVSPWNGGNENFQYDAWRVAMNIAVDFQWFARDEWAVHQSNRLLNFFFSEGIGKYGSLYTLDGKKLSDTYRVGLLSMNAAAAIASTNANRDKFVDELWNAQIPAGYDRYYDGILYLMALLQVSGNFRISLP